MSSNAKSMMSIARTTITYQGRQISYSEARILLNCDKAKTLHKRLAKLRAKGVTTISVEDLLARGVGSGAQKKSGP
jgi:transposase-like protein